MTHTPQPDPSQPGSSLEDELDRRLTRVLETPPRFVIPEGFAARTALLLHTAAPAYPVSSLNPGFSRIATYVALAILVLVMLLLPAFAGTNSPFSIRSEVFFAVELAALITWLSLRRDTAS